MQETQGLLPLPGFLVVFSLLAPVIGAHLYVRPYSFCSQEQLQVSRVAAFYKNYQVVASKVRPSS